GGLLPGGDGGALAGPAHDVADHDEHRDREAEPPAGPEPDDAGRAGGGARRRQPAADTGVGEQGRRRALLGTLLHGSLVVVLTRLLRPRRLRPRRLRALPGVAPGSVLVAPLHDRHW